jgi:flagellar biogenesis protein FliO
MSWATRRVRRAGAAGRRGSAAAAAVQVLSRTHLSSKQKILLIRVGRRVLVVGDGAGGLATLCEIDDPDEVAALTGEADLGPRAGAAVRQGAVTLPAAVSQESTAEAGGDGGVLDDGVDGRANDGDADDDDDENELASTQQELDGLLQRIRRINRQIDRA